MNDWIWFAVSIYCWIMGFVTAWALCNQHNPFWRGWVDVYSLRIFWRRK